MDQQRFLQQLQIVLDPSQGDVKSATGVLQKEFYTKPEALIFLIHIVVSHDNAQLKQLAAVEARSLVSKQWTKTPAQQRSEARTQLLQATMSEQASLVRHAASRLISAIAKVDLEDGEWGELPGLLLQAATSNKPEQRAVGTYILFSVLEIMAEGFTEKFKDLFTLFGRTIQDPESPEVRINTMLALSKMAMVIDGDEDTQSVRAFQQIFPSMVKVLQDAIESENEDRTMQAFEVFQTLLGCDFSLMTKHFADLVKYMVQIAANQDMAEDTRVQAISFLMQCVQYRKMRLQGMKIGEQLTLTMMQIAAEMDDTTDDDDEITPPRSALGLIDMLAQQLPASQVVVPLLHALAQYSNNKDPNYRRAGILSLGMVVEGAPDFISTQIKDIVPILMRLLDDPEVKVRGAALQTVARLADDVPDDLGKEHEKLMPMLFKNLTAAMQAFQGEEDGPNITIMKSGCSAIDAVVDGMDADDAKPYLAQLVPLLSRLFKHPDLKIKGLAASALGSLASTVESAFLPYLHESMHSMQEYVTKKESEEELDLRAAVTDAMGEMAVAVGPDEFQNYVKPLMQASEEALQLDHSRLKESTYILWGSLAKVYEENFTPFIGGAVAGLFNCLEQDEADLEVELGEDAKDLLGKEVTIAGRKVKVTAAEDDDVVPAGEDGDIEDVDIDEDDEDWDDLTTVTPIALEKEIAIEVLGDIVSNTKSAFLPYFEKTVEAILPLAEHNYEGVRKATISTLHRAYATLSQVFEEDGKQEKWKPGLPLQVQPAPEVKQLGEVIMTATLAVWGEEDDRQTVSECSRALSETLKVTGPALISTPGTIEKVVNVVLQLVTQKHPCQEDLAMEEEADISDIETTEFDWLVVDSAMDVISGLAVSLGASFAELWKVFEKQVLKYATGSESLERATAVGVLAEIITGMGDSVTPLTGQLMPLLLKRLGDEDPQVKSNAAYAVGRLVEKSNDAGTISKAYPTILSKLEGLLKTKEARCMDNAAGCVSRLILKNKDAVPTEEVLPALVGTVLPLKEDYQENEPVYNMIIQMYKWEDPTIRSLTPRLVPIFQSVLGEPDEQLLNDTRAQLEELIEYLRKGLRM